MTVSDIPQARTILAEAIRLDEASKIRRSILRALDLMVRRKPSFRCKAEIPKLTRDQKRRAVRLRSTGMPMNRIARMLGTNLGRISEAVNGRRRR
jgi:hypothetical protein